MRLATFNIESLDLASEAEVPFEARVAVLRPALERIAADILCLQEVNGQHVPGAPERRLVALQRLLQGTRYEAYQRAATSGPSGRGVASVHNLVTLSRFPIRQQREVRHQHVKPLLHGYLTGISKGSEPQPIGFDRPAPAHRNRVARRHASQCHQPASAGVPCERYQVRNSTVRNGVP